MVFKKTYIQQQFTTFYFAFSFYWDKSVIMVIQIFPLPVQSLLFFMHSICTVTESKVWSRLMRPGSSYNSVMYLGPKDETFSTLFLEMSHYNMYKAHIWAHLSHYYSWLKLKCSFQINYRFSVPPMYRFVPLNHPVVSLFSKPVRQCLINKFTRYITVCFEVIYIQWYLSCLWLSWLHKLKENRVKRER